MTTPTTERPAPATTGQVDPAAQARLRRRIIMAVCMVAAVLAGLAVAKVLVGALRPHLYSGTVFQESEPAPPLDDLSLVDGSPVDLAAYRGDVVLVFFGYTNCPDVCPTTLSTAADAIERLGADGDRVHLLMVSVDPARDDPETLEAYVDFFDPDFAGAGGDVAAIDRVSSSYGVFYQLGEGTPETGYLVDHTASVMGIGTDGSLRVLWPNGITAGELAADLDDLLS